MLKFAISRALDGVGLDTTKQLGSFKLLLVPTRLTFLTPFYMLAIHSSLQSLQSFNNQDPLEATTGLVPLFGIDVWEHAYYLQVLS